MQTFLPLADFAASAHVLDRQRLGKQRVEAYQILKALDTRTPESGWRNHPAVKMWFGYPFALADYLEAVCTEWISRGYRDSILPRAEEFRWHGLFRHLGNDDRPRKASLPPWLGDEGLHASHRSNLLRKNPDWYAQFGWLEPPTLEYVWPV